MILELTLLIEEKEIPLIKCNYTFNRDIDTKGRPSSSIHGGTITVITEVSADTSIIELMIDRFKAIDGKIIFKQTDKDKVVKEIEFKNGYIIGYRETVDTKTPNFTEIEFTMSTQTMKIGNTKYVNEWPGNF